MPLHILLFRSASIVFTLVLIGCVSSYQPDVVQGNRISHNEIAQVSIGMSKEEVQTVLGNPLVQDMFTGNRWNYFYLKDDVSENVVTQKTLTLDFKDNRLISMSGDIHISEINASQDATSSESTGGTVITQPTQKKKGIFSR